jgi:hypothetical protein
LNDGCEVAVVVVAAAVAAVVAVAVDDEVGLKHIYL